MRTRATTQLLLLLILLALCVAAAAWWIRGYEAKPKHNPPFANKLSVDRVTPNPRFDPVPADPTLYTHVAVLTADGEQVVLDARRHPVLFVAYWCPHCQRTLVALAHHRATLGSAPDIVSMGFVQGTSLAEAKRLTEEEVTALHLARLGKTYYLLNGNTHQYIPNGYPTLVFTRGGQLQMLYGEHAVQVWQTALRGR
ncbi:MAG: hypothetical protein IRZ33_00620 [Alicyclobacillaceae bacterium]|nr:hypothetical protein [Alicyclobacillaceae bacterium]